MHISKTRYIICAGGFQSKVIRHASKLLYPDSATDDLSSNQLTEERRSSVAFQDKTLQCADCGASFTFSAAEQEFFQSKGYTNEPKRCPTCRQARKTERMGAGGQPSHERHGPVRHRGCALAAGSLRPASPPRLRPGVEGLRPGLFKIVQSSKFKVQG